MVKNADVSVRKRLPTLCPHLRQCCLRCACL